jgi:ABC-type multidrug transport system fused ATPase/permease subunit
MAKFLGRFLYLTKGYHKSLVAILLLFLFISSLELIGTGMIGPFIAIATNPSLIGSNRWVNLAYQYSNVSSEGQFLLLLGTVVVVAFFLKAFLAFNAQLKVFSFGYQLQGALANQLMNFYLGAPYSFHLRVNSATLIQNITGTTNNFCLGVVMPMLTTISNSVIILALLFLLIKTDSMALAFVAVLSFSVFGLFKLTKDHLDRWGKNGWQASNETIKMVQHGLGGFKETRILGCEPYFMAQIQEQTKKYATNLALAQGFGNLPRFVIEAVMISFLVGFTLVFISLNQREGESLTAVLGIFALASIRLLPAVGNVVTGVNTIRSNAFSTDKLYYEFKELEEETPVLVLEPDYQSSKSLLGNNSLALSFNKEIFLDSVFFRYPGATKNALHDISLKIRKGQSIGLIGKSGAGKTTLVDILLGLFFPQSGDITVDGTSVYSNLRAWQNLLGYVPQSIFLIDDTLERNIAFGIPDHLIDQDRLYKAIEMAQLSDVVAQLPEGVKTQVGERGVLLSGGQRQRVGIARVLYYEREILVFDEATAALDNETEHLITEATKILSGTKTIIIIAHRLSTIAHCDCIYQLEQGRVVKSGNYQEVVLGSQQ